MLQLTDERWSQLTTFFSKKASISTVLEAWLMAIGLDQEEIIYRRDLFDLFLHQATITNVAFAVVPWLVHVCKQGHTPYQIEYLTDVALVEANRLKYGLYFNREGTDPYPDWLMNDYHQAIIEARTLVDDVLEAEDDEDRKHGLIAMRPALHGNADLAWSQW
jgi:hypothetical protein